MKQKKRHPAEDLASEDIQCLGECVRDLVACLGYGRAEPLEASLFREAVDIAVYQLTLRQGMRRAFREPGDDVSPAYFPIPLEDLAQILIAQTGPALRWRERSRRVDNRGPVFGEIPFHADHSDHIAPTSHSH